MPFRMTVSCKSILSAIALFAPAWFFAGCAAPAPVSPTPTPAPTATALEQRISDSFFLTTDLARHALPSYEIILTGTRDHYDLAKGTAEKQNIDLHAEISGSSLHVKDNSSKGFQAEVAEGYIIGGTVNSIPAGRELVLRAGQLVASSAVRVKWESLPREIGLPLFVASAGAQLAGEETLQGRPVDRYELDSTRSPAGTANALGRTISIKQARGTAWLDRETGALIKMILDYEQNVLDPATSRQTLATGTGHLELTVTQVGAVRVSLP